jgi:DNA-binding NarL/FixJ family response regulator
MRRESPNIIDLRTIRRRVESLPAQEMDRPQKGEHPGRRVLIAEDHKMMREGLRSLLEEKLGYVSVEEASSGCEAVRKAKEFEPDIVIMDIGLPDLNGIEATRQIKTQQPQIEVVVLSMHASRNYVLQVLQAGASAYLLKDSAFEDLATALAAVSKGGMYLSAAITTAAALKNDLTGIATRNLVDAQRLTRRELQVLQLIADGKSTKEIASVLTVSVKTIETHRKQIMDKLGIRSTAGLTKYCIREGLTSL